MLGEAIADRRTNTADHEAGHQEVGFHLYMVLDRMPGTYDDTSVFSDVYAREIERFKEIRGCKKSGAQIQNHTPVHRSHHTFYTRYNIPGTRYVYTRKNGIKIMSK